MIVRDNRHDFFVERGIKGRRKASKLKERPAEGPNGRRGRSIYRKL